MFTNFILATLITLFTLLLLITLDQSNALIHKILRRLLTLSRRSKLLTTYLLKAYLAYRRNVQIH